MKRSSRGQLWFFLNGQVDHGRWDEDTDLPISPSFLGLPVLIVGITLATSFNKYVADNHCWLNVQTEVIWAFVGPVLFVLTVRAKVFGGTPRLSHPTSGFEGPEIGTFHAHHQRSCLQLQRFCDFFFLPQQGHQPHHITPPSIVHCRLPLLNSSSMSNITLGTSKNFPQPHLASVELNLESSTPKAITLATPRPTNPELSRTLERCCVPGQYLI